LLIILLGGIGSLAGAVVGAFAFYGLGEAAQLITERKLLVEGSVILVVVILLRNGLTGIRLPRLYRSPSPPDTPSEARVHG
jgi:branched-chain amino acid transport system permease protein